MTRLDQTVLEWFLGIRAPWLTTVMQTVTLAGGSALLIPLVLAVGAWYRWRRGSTRPFVLLGAAYTGAFVLSHTLKAWIGRARPPAEVALGSYDSAALPSGHATQAAAVWVVLAVVVAAGVPGRGRRAAVGIAAGLVVALVGVSRLYLAAHWLTDVVAGWGVGAGWALLVVVTARRARTPGREPGRGTPPA